MKSPKNNEATDKGCTDNPCHHCPYFNNECRECHQAPTPSLSEGELVEEFIDEHYHLGANGENGEVRCNQEDLRHLLSQTLSNERERMVADIIKLSNELESECNQDGDKGTKQWMAFKGFRNTIRDRYQQKIKSLDK